MKNLSDIKKYFDHTAKDTNNLCFYFIGVKKVRPKGVEFNSFKIVFACLS